MQIFYLFLCLISKIFLNFMEEYIFLECQKLVNQFFGTSFTDFKPLKGAGSARRYFRILIGEKSYIICFSENVAENKTFITLTGYFLESGLPVPEIYGVSDDYKFYILRDLGDIDLMSLLHGRSGIFPIDTVSVIMADLSRFQRLPRKQWNNLVEFPPLGSELIRFDFNYCIDNFFNACGVAYNEAELHREFNLLEKILLSYPSDLWGLMYRDFQSRNIMLADGRPFFIDYQSCRFGPGIYDLVSFAWQAKAAFSNIERMEILDLYCSALESIGVSSTQAVRDNIPYWALFRIIQTLGAYGLRGLKEGKAHFIESIPPALKNINELLDKDGMDSQFPILHDIIKDISIKYVLRP